MKTEEKELIKNWRAAVAAPRYARCTGHGDGEPYYIISSIPGRVFTCDGDMLLADGASAEPTSEWVRSLKNLGRAICGEAYPIGKYVYSVGVQRDFRLPRRGMARVDVYFAEGPDDPYILLLEKLYPGTAVAYDINSGEWLKGAIPLPGAEIWLRSRKKLDAHAQDILEELKDWMEESRPRAGEIPEEAE